VARRDRRVKRRTLDTGWLRCGGGALWIEHRRGLEVSNPAQVYRLDTATRRVTRIAIPALVEGSIAFDSHSLWAGPGYARPGFVG
jgi:hypothetical protein